MKRKDKQFLFSHMLALLILYAEQLGYKVVIGFCFRCKDCPEGKKNSLHKHCLAVDIELHDAQGNYLTETEDHRPLGEFWESIGGTWGGRFEDGNHYSIAHAGMK